MGLGDMVNKAKKALGENSEKINQGLSKAGEAAKSRLGEKHSAKIDSLTGKAKDFVDKNSDDGSVPRQNRPDGEQPKGPDAPPTPPPSAPQPPPPPAQP